MIHRILEVPVPFIPAPFVAQIIPDAPVGPGWVAAFLLGIYVVVYIMDKTGKLPGARKDDARAGIRQEQEHGWAQDVHRVVMREDPQQPGHYLVYGRDTQAISAALRDQDSKAVLSDKEIHDLFKSVQALHDKVDALARELD